MYVKAFFDHCHRVYIYFYFLDLAMGWVEDFFSYAAIIFIPFFTEDLETTHNSYGQELCGLKEDKGHYERKKILFIS